MAGSSHQQTGGNVTLDGQIIAASNADESAVLVSGSGVLAVTNSTIVKAGNTSSQE